MIELGIVNKSGNSLPEYKTIGSSGMDIMAAFLPDRGEILKPGQRTLVHTGLYFEIPEDYEIQVRDDDHHRDEHVQQEEEDALLTEEADHMHQRRQHGAGLVALDLPDVGDAHGAVGELG